MNETPITKESKSRSTREFKGQIRLQDGLWIFGESDFKGSEHAPIDFKLRIHRNDVFRLLSLVEEYPDYFREQFLMNFLRPAAASLRPDARRKVKGTETPIEWIKIFSRCLVNLFSEIVRRNLSPPYYEKLLQEIENRTFKGKKLKYFCTGGKPDPLALAAFCVEWYQRMIGKPLDSLGLQSFCLDLLDKGGYLENFRITYVQGTKNNLKTTYFPENVYKRCRIRIFRRFISTRNSPWAISLERSS
jgi:hypothetical protein